MKMKNHIITEIGGWFLAATFLFVAFKLILLVF